MVRFKNHSMFLSIFIVGLILPVGNLTAMSTEEINAKIIAGQSIREQRAALKELGDFRHVIYTQDKFGKQAKKIIAFRAYGLGIMINQEDRYTEEVKGKEVLFERGSDIFGNESYTNACVDPSCEDMKCKRKSFIPSGMLTKMTKKN